RLRRRIPNPAGDGSAWRHRRFVSFRCLRYSREVSRAYEHRLIVGFEETNLVGNVYYVNHIRWQGRVREMFLRDHAPDVLDELSRGLALATLRCSCEYFTELHAFDEVLIRMTLAEMAQNRITMRYEYWRLHKGGEELAAKGE